MRLARFQAKPKWEIPALRIAAHSDTPLCGHKEPTYQKTPVFLMSGASKSVIMR